MNGAARQKTLKHSIHCSGVGVHSGARSSLVLHPADVETGIVFRRTDLGRVPIDLAADWTNAVEMPLCTMLTHESGAKVGTVEHLLAALTGCGIDNALIEVNGPEVPIMDGSASPFVFLLHCAGRVEQSAPRRALRILDKVEISDGDRYAALEPADGFGIDFEIDFASAIVGRQRLFVDVNEETFAREIARARTFGFLEDIDNLRAQGLALGGSLDNAVVVGDGKILNEGGLRYEDEFVRHKILDSIGDLYLVGGPIIGLFTGVRAGHAFTLRLLRELFARPDAWEWIELNETAPAARGSSWLAPSPAVAGHI